MPLCFASGGGQYDQADDNNSANASHINGLGALDKGVEQDHALQGNYRGNQVAGADGGSLAPITNLVVMHTGAPIKKR